MPSGEQKCPSAPSKPAERKTNYLKRKDLRNACMSKSQVFVCYSGSYFVARHNADLNLSGTESECVTRLWAIGLQSAYIPKPLKESLEPLNDCFFLRLAIFTTAAEAGHGRKYFVYVRTCCLDTAVTESACHKCPGFFLFELFLGYQSNKCLFTLLGNIAVPLIHNIVNIVDTVDEVLDKVFLASQLRAGINRLLNGDKHFLIRTMTVMILRYKHKNIVDIDLYLLDKLDLKDNIIVNIGQLTFLRRSAHSSRKS